ncbi:response regulator [Flavobacteriaceae bacterium TP-CH-4]|uniref:Response regulator n=1 Tax=Pelagihabitans pacificus TaxID=2696054 RepID=A0A967B0T3_9FLAO|nr:response regulator [Pelagihabitans pacificus]NHF60026.1 response regulator [Pelagihabitans pacificus]
MKSNTPTLKSVLLVDDDHSNNFINKIFIDQLGLGVKVSTALNGLEALDHLRHSFEGPCLLVLDIKMPVMDGWEFLEAYHTSIPQVIKDDIVIVMITVSTDHEDMEKAKKNPYVVQYIQKPLSDLKFQRLIKKYF